MENAKIIDDKKFMWDGNTYEKEENAKNTMKEYENYCFETRLVTEEGKFDVYTRRVVTEIGLEEEASI